MNCNTTHYRANSSSVPGDPTEPATLDADITGSATIANRTFELELGLSKAASTTANVTARFAGKVRLNELAGVFPGVSDAATDKLRDIEVGPVAATVVAGGGESAFELTAATRVEQVEADLLLSVRPGAGFSFGLKPRGRIELKQLVSGAPELKLPNSALLLGNTTATRPVAQLTDGEYDFYKTLYGCAADASRTACPKFKTLAVTPGLRLLAGFDLGDNVEKMTEALGVQTGGDVMLEGTLPILGGRTFAVKASLGEFQFAQAPEWYDNGTVSLEIGTDGLRLAGQLGVKIARNGGFDRLKFEVAAKVGLKSPSLTLTGSMKGDGWNDAFGQQWLDIKRVALQLGVKLTTGPEVTMGFQGDLRIGDKDIAAALKVGMAPAPPPAFVRPNLIGVSAASVAGVSLKDMIELNRQITGVKLDAGSMPDVSLRNLFFQFSQENDADLCLTQGLRFNADLYVGKDLPAPAGPVVDPNGCRVVDTDPATRATCLAHKADGCLASVYGRFDTAGLVAGGELNAFTLGPIEFKDSSVNLALTATKQQLRVKGGVRIGSGSYEFASGNADLDISKDGFAFKGDAAMFDRAFQGYLEANAAFDLKNPSFQIKTWLKADSRALINNTIGAEGEKLRPVIVAVGNVLNVMLGNGSLPKINQLPTLLRQAGADVPWQVQEMADTLGEMQAEISEHGGPALSFDVLLRGLNFQVPGTPGLEVPGWCAGIMWNGSCKGEWVPATCVTTWGSDGRCYSIPPFGVSVPGLCAALSIPNWSADCSWSGLMAKFVRPAILAGFKAVTGVELDAAGLSTLVARFANAAASIVSLDCAYFSADATALAQGKMNVELATKLKFFGHAIDFGTAWNFSAAGSNPKQVMMEIIKSLMSAHSITCPAPPAGFDQAPAVTGNTLNATVASIGNGEMKLSATFTDAELRYPAVDVLWGDGSTSTIPAGDSRTVSITHAYPNAGNYAAAVTVADAKRFTQSVVASVPNVAPKVTALTAQPVEGDEGGEVTVTGTFTDAGTAARHTVRVDWGDRTTAEYYTVAAGARTFKYAHRYLNQADTGIKVQVVDDGGLKADADVRVLVRNVAPSGIKLNETMKVYDGAMTTFALEFRDPGELDRHDVTINWGDGTPVQRLRMPDGARRIELPHRYERKGEFRPTVTVADDDRGTITTELPALKVRNSTPVLDFPALGSIKAGDSARVRAKIEDLSPADVHTVVVDWGGSVPAAERRQTITLEPGARSFEVFKPITAVGTHPITVEINDGHDEGRAKASRPLTVTP